MLEITIDADVCKKDGFGTMAYTRAIFRQEEKCTIPKISSRERCFGCGHCVAICPHGAISHSNYPDVIGKVLEAARFAPSGHNDQSTEFVVIQDK